MRFLFAVKCVVAFLSAAGAARAAPSTGAANEPQILRQELSRACEGKRATLGKQWGERVDLDGDGQLDLIVDHGGILCNGERGNVTCGFRACDLVIFLQRRGRLVEVYNILSIGYELGGGKPPLVTLTGHNFEESAVRWNGSAFVNAPASQPSPQPPRPQTQAQVQTQVQAQAKTDAAAKPVPRPAAPNVAAPGVAVPSGVAPAKPPQTAPAGVDPGGSSGGGSSSGAGGGIVAAAGARAGVPAAGARAGQVPVRWHYGYHPILGLSAYVEAGDKAVGLTCGFAGRNPTRGDPVEMRVTSNLAYHPETVFAFQSGHIGGNVLTRNPRGYASFRENSCGTGIDDFRTQAHLMILPPGKVMSITAQGQVNRIVYTLATGATYQLQGPGQMDRVPGTIFIPLTGAPEAIARLVAACPALRDDIANNCGI